MPVTHGVFRLQEVHDGHVLLKSSGNDDLLPLGNRLLVLLLNGGKVRGWSVRRPSIGHGESTARFLIRCMVPIPLDAASHHSGTERHSPLCTTQANVMAFI